MSLVGVVAEIMRVKTVDTLLIEELVARRAEIKAVGFSIRRQRLTSERGASRKARAAALATVRFPGDDNRFTEQFSAHSEPAGQS